MAAEELQLHPLVPLPALTDVGLVLGLYAQRRALCVWVAPQDHAAVV